MNQTLGNHKSYKCALCNKKYKKYSKWLENHFIRKHDNSLIKLTRI